jgi:hypothetical protein
MPRRKLVKPTKSVTFRLDEELVDAARNTQEDPVTMDVTDLANIILQR